MGVVYLPHFASPEFGWRWLFNLDKEDCEVVSYGVETVKEEGKEIERIHLHPVGVVPRRNIALVRLELETDQAQMIDMGRPSRWIQEGAWFDPGGMDKPDALWMVGELLSAGVVDASAMPGSSLYMDRTRTYVPPREVKVWDSRDGAWAIMDEAKVAQPERLAHGAVPVIPMKVETVEDEDDSEE